MYPGAQRAYVSYEIAGSANINQTYVNTYRTPLPAPDTFYHIPAVNSLDGSVKLKINTGILGLDPNRNDPNDANARYPDRPGSTRRFSGSTLRR